MEIKQGKKFKILPAAPGTCAMCAVKHDPGMAHNLQSLFYGVRFKLKYGRDPTWADAVAHCSPEMITHWKQELEKADAWTEHPEPIAEPYAESTGGV